MKTTSGFFTPACRAALTAACLLALTGCRGEPRETDSPGHDEGHAGHVIPAHKPKNFPDAVRRLRELNGQFGLAVSREQPGVDLDGRTLSVALDIALWLPEIAADSDMPKETWNKVNRSSAIIVAEYRKIPPGAATSETAAQARVAVNRAGQSISDLETLLAGADPRWFDQDAKVGARL